MQTANPTLPMRSSQVDLDFFLSQCVSVFGNQYVPNEKKTNGYFGGVHIGTTNTVFTNGLQDPWQWASLMFPMTPIPTILANCQTCAHCFELKYSMPLTDDPEVTKAKEQVAVFFQTWINQHLAKFSFD